MALRTPIVRHATLAAGATASLTFGATHGRLGTAHIKNIGVGSVSVKFDAIPVVGVADDQFLLAPGDAYNTDVVVFNSIGLRDQGLGCEVQIVAYVAAQGDVR